MDTNHHTFQRQQQQQQQQEQKTKNETLVVNDTDEKVCHNNDDHLMNVILLKKQTMMMKNIHTNNDKYGVPYMNGICNHHHHEPQQHRSKSMTTVNTTTSSSLWSESSSTETTIPILTRTGQQQQQRLSTTTTMKIPLQIRGTKSGTNKNINLTTTTKNTTTTTLLLYNSNNNNSSSCCNSTTQTAGTNHDSSSTSWSTLLDKYEEICRTTTTTDMGVDPKNNQQNMRSRSSSSEKLEQLQQEREQQEHHQLLWLSSLLEPPLQRYPNQLPTYDTVSPLRNSKVLEKFIHYFHRYKHHHHHHRRNTKNQQEQEEEETPTSSSISSSNIYKWNDEVSSPCSASTKQYVKSDPFVVSTTQDDYDDDDDGMYDTEHQYSLSLSKPSLSSSTTTSSKKNFHTVTVAGTDSVTMMNVPLIPIDYSFQIVTEQRKHIKSLRTILEYHQRNPQQQQQQQPQQVKLNHYQHYQHYHDNNVLTIVFAIRRPGCGACREHALQIRYLVHYFYHYHHIRINCIGIMKEINNNNNITKNHNKALLEFVEQYYPYPIYKDEHWTLYHKYLGNRRLHTWHLLKNVYRLNYRYKKVSHVKNIPFGGDLFTLGGFFLFDSNNTLKHTFYEHYGELLDLPLLYNAILDTAKNK